jgi:hypothetical protein
MNHPPEHPGRRPPRRHEPIEPVPQGTWLVAPYGDADDGARPTPAGVPFWQSPYIWMRDMAGNVVTQAVAGQPVRVFTRIRNRGTLTSFPTRVSFAFIDAALGIPASAPKVFGQRRVNVPPHVLGSGVADVECPVPWVPGESSTHACLLVMCDGELMDRPTTPWSPPLDRHVAQRNVTIVPASPGKTLPFPLQALALQEGGILLAARAAWVQARDPMEALRYGMGRRRPLGRPLSPDALRQSLRLKGVEEGPVSEAGELAPGYFVMSGRVDTAPGEPLRMDAVLTVPEREAEAPFLVFHLAQLEGRTVTGGYTFVLQLGA